MKKSICLTITLISLSTTLAYASGNASNGQKLYLSRCIACHSIDVSMAGPSHRGVYGRKAGSVNDFEYSKALKKSNVTWNEKTLNKWLTNPEKFIPGQKMGISVSDATERDDLIAFLKEQIKQ